MSERKLSGYEWLMIGVLIGLLVIFVVFGGGCQWSAYNSVSVDPNDGVTQRVGIGTIELLVVDQKKGLHVRTWEGTVVDLNDTKTDPDEPAIKAAGQAVGAGVGAAVGIVK